MYRLEWLPNCYDGTNLWDWVCAWPYHYGLTLEEAKTIADKCKADNCNVRIYDESTNEIVYSA